jgi:hypothetical protein
MPFEIIVYMLEHRHSALNKALYGEEHGFNERVLQLKMVSSQGEFEIKMPVVCRMRTTYFS